MRRSGLNKNGSHCFGKTGLGFTPEEVVAVPKKLSQHYRVWARHAWSVLHRRGRDMSLTKEQRDDRDGEHLP